MASLMKRWVVCCLILGGLFSVALGLLRGWSPSILGLSALQSQVVTTPPAKQIILFGLGRQRQAVRKLPVDEIHRYTVELKKGDLLDAAVDQDIVPAEKIDVAVRLIGPGGFLYEINSTNKADGYEQIYLLAEQDGNYYVEIEAGNAGTYRIRVSAIKAANAAERVNVEAEKLFYHARAMLRERPARYQQASIEYRAAGKLWRGLGNQRREANALEQEGFCLYNKGGDWEETLKVRMAALRLYHGLADHRAEVRLLVSVGATQMSLGDLERAESYLRQALEIATASGYREQEADALTNLGFLFDQKGEKRLALDFYEKALRLWQEAARPADQIRTLELIGVLYSALGNVRYALQYFREAERILGRSDNDQLRAECLTRISEIYRAMDRLGESLAYARRALALSKKNGDTRGGAVTMNIMALTYRTMGDLGQARDFQQQALTVFRQDKNVHDEAIAHYNLGLILLDAKDLPGAIEHFDRTATLANELKFLEGEIAGLYGMALGEKLNGNPIAARNFVRKALALIESVPKMSLSASSGTTLMEARLGSYELFIDLLIASPASYTPPEDMAAAFEASERARWRVLLDSLTPSQLGRGLLTPENTTFAEERERLTNEIARTEDERNKLNGRGLKYNEILKIQKDLVARLRTLEARSRPSKLSGPAPVSLKEAQRLLDRDTVLLEYFLGKHRSFLWLVTPSSIDVYEIQGRQVIEKSAKQLHELLSESQFRGNEERAARVTRELSQLLLGPVAGRLNGKRLVVVPDGAIHYVPFAALVDPAGEAPVPLAASKEIVYQPSMSVLRAIRAEVSRRKSPPGLLAVLADPNFIPEEYDRLEHSGKEARKILGLVSPREKKFQALGCEANRDLVLSGKLAQFRYLHFATHGENHPQEPELSAIVLSQVGCDGRRRDGHLRLQDIKNLDLRADLVVLSACQTALGNEVAGEGFEGLAEGFMYAGAAGVVVSLWNVDDESTSALMEHFYRGIFIDKLSPSEALRRAQLWMVEKTSWRSPYFWAGFEVQGEWR